MNIQNLIERGGTTIPPVENQARAFLEVMWGALPANTVIGLSVDTEYFDRKTNALKSSSVADWALIDEDYDFEQWAAQQNNNAALVKSGHGSIFWNIAARKQIILSYPSPAYKRGKSHELAAVCVFNVDLDIADKGYDYNAAFDGILAFPLKPTAVVFSGGGFQVLWALSEAWSVDNPAEVAWFKAYCRKFQQMVSDHLGIEPDYKTAEPARMLRLPGFINRKLKRNGALAQLVYWSPDTRYTIADMLAFIGELPEPPERPHVTYTPEDGVYLVGNAFVDYFIHGVTRAATERHGALLQVACEAAKAGIPRDLLEPHIRALAIRWYADEPYDQGPYGELDDMIDWAYQKFDLGDLSEGTFSVQLTASGFERVIASEIPKRSQRGEVIPIDNPPEPPEQLPLNELRKVQRTWIDDMMREEIRNIARLYLLATSPGTGKTHDLLHAILLWILEAIARGYAPDMDKGRALFLTQFKIDETKTDEWLREQDIPEEHWHLFGFFFARDKNPSSKGYCENHEKATVVGNKGHNVVETLCAYCPFQQKCRESGYLSQFKRLERKAIAIGRWQHGYMEELASYRKFIVFDESVLDLVSEPIKVSVDEMVLRHVAPMVADQYATEVALVDCFLNDLRAIMRENKGLRLGGAWLRDELIRRFGTDNFARLVEIPNKVVKGINPFDVADLSNLANALPNYLLKLIELLRYEHAHVANQYNSRLIPYKTNLYIFPMEPFRFTSNTRVFAADATPIPEYYRLLFADKHTTTIEKADGTKETVRRPRPRQLEIFDTQLKPRATVTVYYGSENTKRAYQWNAETTDTLEVPDAATPVGKLDDDALIGISQQNYTMRDTIKLATKVRKLNVETAQLMIMIHRLAIRHKRKLLVVLYKFLVGDAENQTFLQRWLEKSGIIPMRNVQWFYSLRGKNDWKDCEAVLLVGTPRIRQEDLFMKAQALHYDDPNPISTERQWRVQPYASRDSDGKAWGYRYYGYKDERVNRLYVHLIASELRQDYERIRANLIDGKHVYLASPFPCSDHVDHLTRWEIAVVDQCVHELFTKIKLEYDDKIRLGIDFDEYTHPEVYRAIGEAAQCSYNTAKNRYWEILRNGISDFPHDTEKRKATWAEVFNNLSSGKKLKMKSAPLSREDRVTNLLMNGVGKMLESAGQLSPAKVRKQYLKRFPDDTPTDKDVMDAIQRYKNLSKLAV